MKKKILITENIIGPGIDSLRQKYDCRWDKDLWQKPEEILGIADQFEAIIVRNQTKVTADLLEAATRCQVLGRAGVGVDNVDVNVASELGIVVAFTPEENAISVAEEVMGMMLCLAKRFVGADASVKAGKWDRMAFLGVELYGKALGIIGLGKIGARVAMRARAFGMRIIAYDPYLTRHHIHVTESQAELVDLETLLRTSDFITIHLPLTAETRHLIDQDRLRRMKSTAYLINTSRGPIVNEVDLYEALAGKVIAGAALDVRETEPPQASPLNSLENILLTPHVAAFTVEAQDKVQESLSEDVDRVLTGKPALRFANFASPRRSA
jgi:D-3-phosphoglycerate dehydrogenase / 2-oxoglutarate reductase